MVEYKGYAGVVELVDSVDLGDVTSVRVLRGIAMEWKEMSTLQKAVCIVSVLCVIAYCTVSILSFELGVLENTRMVECLLGAAFCLGFGFISTGRKRVGWYLFSAFEFLLFLMHWMIRS